MPAKSKKRAAFVLPPTPVLKENQKNAAVKLTPLICKFLVKLSNDSKRRNIISEMIATERNYVESLCICEEVYYKPLERSIASKSPLIDTDTLRQLFGNIDQIRDVHQNQILKVLDEAMTYLKKPFPPHTAFVNIANVFIEVVPRLQQLYPSYLQSNENYLEILKKLKKNKKFNNFLNEALFNPESKCQEIDDLLILPTQRIAGYKLLFERIIKYFPVETHKEENAKFKAAYNALMQVGKEMNSEKGDSQSQNALLSLAENVTGQPTFFCLMKPGRRVMDSFKCREIDERGKLLGNVIIYILSDIVLITSKAERSIFSFNKVKYIDAVPFTKIRFSAFDNQKELDRAFVLMTDINRYNLWSKSSIDRDNFVMCIKRERLQIISRVKLMSKNGAEYMQKILMICIINQFNQ